MDNRELIEEIRQNAKEVSPRSLVLNQFELGAFFDHIEAQERRIESLEEELGIQQMYANQRGDNIQAEKIDRVLRR